MIDAEVVGQRNIDVTVLQRLGALDRGLFGNVQLAFVAADVAGRVRVDADAERRRQLPEERGVVIWTERENQLRIEGLDLLSAALEQRDDFIVLLWRLGIAMHQR